MGDGSVAELLWARPSATVLGIDVPPVIGSSSAVQASAAARVSLRLPPGVTGKEAQDALVAHLRSRVPWSLQLRDRARRGRRPVRGLARRARVRGDEGRDGGGLRAPDDDRGPGRLDPALQRARRHLPGRRDHADRRRGAEVPDPRAERERRPVRRSSTSRSPRRSSSRTTRAHDRLSAPFTAADFAGAWSAPRPGAGRRPDRRARDAGSRPRLLHRLRADRDHRADHAARRPERVASRR